MGLLPGWFMRMGCLRFCPHLPLVKKLACVYVSPTTRVSSPLGVSISHLTTLPDPPATLSIRSLVLVRLHRLLLTIGGKVVDINPPSLSHELPCQTSRCNWLPCGGPHHPSKEETRKLMKTRQRDECGKTPEGRNARRDIHTRVHVCRYTYGVFSDSERAGHVQVWKIGRH